MPEDQAAALLDQMCNKPGLEDPNTYNDDPHQPTWAYDEAIFNCPPDIDTYGFPNLSQLPPSRELKSPQPYHEPRNRGNNSKADSETVTRPGASTIQDLVNARHQQKTNYESFADAIKARIPWMIAVFGDPQPTTPTTPTPPDPAEDKALVLELVRAIKSTDYAKDNANMVAPFKILKKYNDQRIEFVAWYILVSNLLVVLIAPLRHVHILHRL